MSIHLEMIKIGVESGDRQLKGWGLGAKAVFDLRMGHLDEAVEKLLEAKILLESIPDYYALVVTQIDLMHCYVYKKQFNDAYASIKRAEDLILQKNLKGFVLSLFKNAVCDFYLRAREKGVQIDEEITLRKIKKQIVQTIGLGRKYKCGLSGAYRVTGNYYRLKGQLNKARRYWEKGLEISQDLGARYEEGLIWFEMGRHFDDMNHLNKAKNIFQEINSKYELSILNEMADISRPDL
jgi:tetratricopeptide (TPR) repeat protein